MRGLYAFQVINLDKSKDLRIFPVIGYWDRIPSFSGVFTNNEFHVFACRHVGDKASKKR